MLAFAGEEREPFLLLIRVLLPLLGYRQVLGSSTCNIPLHIEYALTAETVWTDAATKCSEIAPDYTMAEFLDNEDKYNAIKTLQKDGIGDGKELWTGLKRTVGMSSDCCGSSCNAYLKWKVSGSNYVHQDFVEETKAKVDGSCVFFKDGKFDGKSCSEEYNALCQRTVTVCPNELVNGAWSEWQIGTCSLTCGDGLRTNTRTCSNPARANGGEDCPGSTTQQIPCNQGSCPVNGGWTEWTPVSQCNTTCGGGELLMERYCTDPAPQNGGAVCNGSNANHFACNNQPCPVSCVQPSTPFGSLAPDKPIYTTEIAKLSFTTTNKKLKQSCINLNFSTFPPLTWPEENGC